MTREERRRKKYVSLVKEYISNRYTYEEFHRRADDVRDKLADFDLAIEVYRNTGEITKELFDDMASMYRKKLEKEASFWDSEGDFGMERNEKYAIGKQLEEDYGVDLDELYDNIPYSLVIPESIIMATYKG